MSPTWPSIANESRLFVHESETKRLWSNEPALSTPSRIAAISSVSRCRAENSATVSSSSAASSSTGSKVTSSYRQRASIGTSESR